MKIDQPGRYQVWITYSAQKQWEGVKYRLSVGSAALEDTVFDTGAYCFDLGGPCEPGFQYRTYNAGIVDLSQAGEYKVAIRPAVRIGHNLMYLKSIELTPVQSY